jgi:hypothetical protein
MSLLTHSQAEEDFTKARNRALLHEIQNFLNPGRNQLLSFNEVKQILKPKNEVYAGIQTVLIDRIVGSEGRYQDFDNHFLPKTSALRHRWKKVDEALLTDKILPPIKLYELGGLYFVRDGNHRVSVAKAQGVTWIDAEVISLKSDITLKPGVTADTLLEEIIKHEKRTFYTDTGFGDLTDYWSLDFTSPGQYDVILNHIMVHKYYMNEKVSQEIPLEEAILSWYKNVYQPVLKVIKKHRLLGKFKKRTSSDLYVWIIKQWDDLKRKYGGDYSLDEATQKFLEGEDLPSWAKLLSNLKKLWQNLTT